MLHFPFTNKLSQICVIFLNPKCRSFVVSLDSTTQKAPAFICILSPPFGPPRTCNLIVYHDQYFIEEAFFSYKGPSGWLCGILNAVLPLVIRIIGWGDPWIDDVLKQVPSQETDPSKCKLSLFIYIKRVQWSQCIVVHYREARRSNTEETIHECIIRYLHHPADNPYVCQANHKVLKIVNSNLAWNRFDREDVKSPLLVVF